MRSGLLPDPARFSGHTNTERFPIKTTTSQANAEQFIIAMCKTNHTAHYRKRKPCNAAVNPTTVQGGRLTVATGGGNVTVNGARVTATDIAASNGVIHVIDTVVMPR